jgi:hypothetical protein
MLLIVPCQDGFCRSRIGNRRIERRLFPYCTMEGIGSHFALAEESGQVLHALLRARMPQRYDQATGREGNRLSRT